MLSYRWLLYGGMPSGIDCTLLSSRLCVLQTSGDFYVACGQSMVTSGVPGKVSRAKSKQFCIFKDSVYIKGSGTYFAFLSEPTSKTIFVLLRFIPWLKGYKENRASVFHSLLFDKLRTHTGTNTRLGVHKCSLHLLIQTCTFQAHYFSSGK